MVRDGDGRGVTLAALSSQPAAGPFEPTLLGSQSRLAVVGRGGLCVIIRGVAACGRAEHRGVDGVPDLALALAPVRHALRTNLTLCPFVALSALLTRRCGCHGSGGFRWRSRGLLPFATRQRLAGLGTLCTLRPALAGASLLVEQNFQLVVALCFLWDVRVVKGGSFVFLVMDWVLI